MKNKWLAWLLAAVLIKGLVWLWLIPIFQVPDEPSHFSIVAFMAENHRRAHPRREVVTPAAVMKTAEAVNFNWQIIHPVWLGYDSNWRQQLTALTAADQLAVEPNSYQQSLKRPAGYYWLVLPAYWLGGGSLLGQFFAVRGFSLLIHLITVWLVYLIVRKVFASHRLGLAGAALVGFQPMVSFISGSVHYDPLAILVATLFGWLMVNGQSRQALLTALAGLLVKPDLLFLPLVWLGRRLWLGLTAVLLLLVALAGPVEAVVQQRLPGFDGLLYLINLNEYTTAAVFYWQGLVSGQIWADLVNYVMTTGPVHAAQIFPWYWGTFGWLEAPLPGGVFAAIKLAILLSLLGWIKFIHQNGFPRKMVFWLGFGLLQAGLVIANDFQFFAGRGEIYGIQGRYFFPGIVAQMILMIFGWKQWLKPKVLAPIIIGGSVWLNFIGLLTAYNYFGWVWAK